jgi:hypothetical protein
VAEEDQDQEHPEDEVDPAPGATTALPPKLEAWRRRSAAGAILTGFALGLQEALENKKDEPAIVMQTSGDPPKDLPVEADFEYGRPRQSVVQIRPWLLNGDRPAPSDGPETTDTPDT